MLEAHEASHYKPEVAGLNGTRFGTISTVSTTGSTQFDWPMTAQTGEGAHATPATIVPANTSSFGAALLVADKWNALSGDATAVAQAMDGNYWLMTTDISLVQGGIDSP